jgi:hypothetical protein
MSVIEALYIFDEHKYVSAPFRKISQGNTN